MTEPNGAEHRICNRCRRDLPILAFPAWHGIKRCHSCADCQKRRLQQRHLDRIRTSPVLTTGDVAKLCRCSMRTVARWVDSGQLKGYHIPGSQDRRILRESLIRFLKKNNMPLGDLVSDCRHRLLLVGTSDDLTHTLTTLLPECLTGHATTAYAGGVLVQTLEPDTVVLDFSLGRGDCIQIAADIHADANRGTVRVIALTNEDEADSDDWLLGHGFTAIFRRPFDPALLAAKVKNGIESPV